ncbi:MAG: type III pantothenate kinase [Campylobacterota bacterium]|nr:type III pantothenate kinase [Campylobacterota bacterium]
MILCDIGNTTYHFKIKNKNFKIGVEEKIQNLPKLEDQIYFISVNEKATKKLIKKYPTAIDIKSILKFETNYKGMGIDRQIVCSYYTDGIIVDSGSAITVDIMDKGIHLGGFILPGLEGYKKIYPKISKKLSFDFKNELNLDKIPLNTNDAINYALLNAIILPILGIYKQYNKKIYFTGENSKYLLEHFKDIPYKYKKNMIFNSMKKTIKQKEN